MPATCSPPQRRSSSVSGLALGAVITCLVVSTAAAPGAQADFTALSADPEAQTLRVLYNGYFGAFRIMKVSLDTAEKDDVYGSSAVFRSAGIAGFFKDTEIHASAAGEKTAGGLKPALYTHHNLKSKKDRRIRIDFNAGLPVSTVTPPFGSMGQPPASDAQRLGAFDPISGFLSMMMRPTQAPCSGVVPMFDGKQRYDLRFEAMGEEDIDVRGYEGAALRCHAFYEPIAGFDPEDLAEPEVYAKPIEMWFANVGEGLHVPVRFVARMQGVRVRVEAKTIQRG